MGSARVGRRSLLRWAGLAAAGLVGAGVVARTSRRVPVTAPSASGAPSAPAGSTPAVPQRLVALIANSLGNTLTVADARTLEPISTIPVGREPHKFRLTRSSRAVYSCNTTSNELIEIDLATLHPARRIPILDPYNVIFTKDGRYLYKVAYRYDFVEIHDGETFHTLKTAA